MQNIQNNSVTTALTTAQKNPITKEINNLAIEGKKEDVTKSNKASKSKVKKKEKSKFRMRLITIEMLKANLPKKSIHDFEPEWEDGLELSGIKKLSLGQNIGSSSINVKRNGARAQAKLKRQKAILRRNQKVEKLTKPSVFKFPSISKGKLSPIVEEKTVEITRDEDMPESNHKASSTTAEDLKSLSQQIELPEIGEIGSIVHNLAKADLEQTPASEITEMILTGLNCCDALKQVFAWYAVKFEIWKSMGLSRKDFAKEHVGCSVSELGRRKRRVEDVLTYLGRVEFLLLIGSSALDSIHTVLIQQDKVKHLEVFKICLLKLINGTHSNITGKIVKAIIKNTLTLNESERDTEEDAIERKSNKSSAASNEAIGSCDSTCTPKDGNDQAESNKSHRHSKSALPKHVLSAPESFTVDEATILVQLKEVFKPLEGSYLSKDTYCQISTLLFEEANLFKSLAEAKDH